MFVGQDLKLDMAGVFDIALQIEVTVAEGGRSFRLRLVVEGGQFVFVADNAHTPSAAARRGLDDDRKSDSFRPFARIFRGCDYPIRAGNDRYAVLLHGGASFLFLAHQADDVRRGTDE